MFSFYISASCKASQILTSAATMASRGSGFGSGVVVVVVVVVAVLL